MKNYVKYIGLSVMTCIALTGCIRDDIQQCPGLSVVLAVKDRVYANANSTGYDDPGMKATKFNEIVPTLYCVLREAQTGEIVREMPLSPVEGNEATHSIVFDNALPYGDYIVTVWGDVNDASKISTDGKNFDLSDLDHNLYLAHDLVHYAYDSDKVYGELQRVNGMVIVETHWETFPAGINASEKSFSGLKSVVNDEMQYTEEQEILVGKIWETSQDVTSYTVLPPSVRENGTTLHIRYFDKDKPEQKGIVPDDIRLTVRRNEITKIRIAFDPYSQSIKVATMVNGVWQIVEDMKVD